MERLEDRVRERCTELIAEIAGTGHCDFMRDFAWRYPTTIFMELMGLPLGGLDQFLGLGAPDPAPRARRRPGSGWRFRRHDGRDELLQRAH